MSHFTTVNTEIRDLAALRDACSELGLELKENTQARGYGSASLNAPHVIRLNGPYDIAVLPGDSASAPHTLTTDWWGGHVEKEVGPKFGKLLQLYAVHKATREARRRGHRVARKQAGNGAIRLVIQGGALA